MTFDLISSSRHFSTLSISDTTRDRAKVTIDYRASIGRHMRSIAWWHFQWPWRTLNPVFKVTFWSRISQKRCILGTKLLIGNHTQSIEWYHFQWPWVTSDPDFKVTTLFEVEYRKNDASKRQSYYCTRGEIPNIWNGTILWPWLTSKCVAPLCQHQLSFLFVHYNYAPI